MIPAAVLQALLFLLAGVVLALVLIRVVRQTEGRQGDSAAPHVKLVRAVRTAEGHEETRLLLNGQTVLLASNDGVRLADYAEEVEQLEALAARMAAALQVGVEFERVGGHPGGPADGIPVRDLPQINRDNIDAEERRRRLDREQGAAG